MTVDPSALPPPSAPRFVVGLGASAGGLEALEQFFDVMPRDSGIAFVIAQHLSPDHKSLMVEILSKRTRMRVVQADEGMPLAPDTVFLLPPRKVITVRAGHLLLSERPTTALSLPIDILFRSLADDYGERAIVAVLSGTGSDGMRGVQSVKEVGGLVLVQEPTTAKFDGMPRAALSTGISDMVLAPSAMPMQIMHYIATSGLTQATGDRVTNDDAFGLLLALLRRQSGVDFTHYKPSTIVRRIHRRMAVCHASTLEEYVALAQRSTREVAALFKDLLISVTKFFRDAEAFKSLYASVVQPLVDGARPGEPLRVWVAGCATGEEAYSLAMLFEECAEASGRPCDVKIFATDIDRDALEVASAGVYPESAIAELAPARVTRFFVRRGDDYQVVRTLRQRVVFAHHDLTSDPPFSRISLVSCRNLLIYFDAALQRRLLVSFRFALLPGSYLFLGPSEALGDLAESLPAIDQRWRIFRNAHPLPRGELRVELDRPMGVQRPPIDAVATAADPSVASAYEELVRAYAPPTLLINDRHDIVHLFGAPSPLLRFPSGAATLNALQLLPRALTSILSLATARALRDQNEVRYHSVPVDDDDVNLTVRPVHGRADRRQLLLVTLESAKARLASGASPEAISDDAKAQIDALQQELQRSRENLQATIEELETSNEELQATNEELVASNEEMQATNEELQSVNEELHTVNTEYQQKIQQLVELNDDVHNLLRSTEIGTLFLDEQLRIAWFTPHVSTMLNVLDRDVGRAVSDLTFQFDAGDLLAVLDRVQVSRQTEERQVTARDGRTVLIRVLPYIAQGAARRGLVVTFTDVSALSRAERRLSQVIDALPQQVAVLDRRGVVTITNRAWREFAKFNAGDASRTGVGVNYLEVCASAEGRYAEEAASVLAGLRDVLEGRASSFQHEYPCHAPTQRRWFLMFASPVDGGDGGLVVSHVDITARKLLELKAATNGGSGEL